MSVSYPEWRRCKYKSHSPWRKSKSGKNTHNFWHYFLGLFTKGNINFGVPEMWDGSFLHNCKKVWWNLKKMPKKGKIGFKFFSHHNICQIVTFGAFSNFKDFFSLVLLQPTIFSTFEKISPENRVLKGPKWKSFKNKNSDKSYYLPYVRMWKIF